MHRFLFRIIIPAFSNFNIYSRIAKITTALGPVIVATVANKLAMWDVEVIDENNCRSRLCPKDQYGRPDHVALQRERPADVVGFYGSLTSTVPRLYELAALYKQMQVMTIAGGKHVENLPEEALANSIDFVVFGEGEKTIQEFLLAYQNSFTSSTGFDYSSVAGIGFLQDGKLFKTVTRSPITDFDEWPLPDFKLVRYAKIKIFPTSGIRGCDSNCEFCSVKDKTRCATPQRMMSQVAYLVEVHGARKFFEPSDHFAADRKQAIGFCRLLADYQKRKGVKLQFTVQVRVTDARYPELLQAMQDAGIKNVCIGFESPIDQELIAMKKGYVSKEMVNWAEAYHRHGFAIHGMFIFGYPPKDDDKRQFEPMTIDERVRRFQNFIKMARVETCQVLLTIPLPGTDLRDRLEADGRIYPLDIIGWEYYDGQFQLFVPDDGVDPLELQKAVAKIMGRFYHVHHFWFIVLNIMVNFPAFVFPSTLTLATMRVRYITSAYANWKRTFFRTPAIRFGGWLMLRGWMKNFRQGTFLEKLKQAQQKLATQKNKR